MRREFIECASVREAAELAPWAAVIAAADGGYWAFESESDYRAWKGQK